MPPKDEDQALQDLSSGMKALSIDSNIMQSLSATGQEALVKLKEIQNQHFTIEQEFEKEWIALKGRYETQFKPLYQKRSEILHSNSLNNGLYTTIPKFWVTVFNKNFALKNMIEESDVPILEYLLDIESEWDDMNKLESFTLTFKFAPNPHFTNTEIKKHFEIERIPGEEDPIFKSTKSTKIEWHHGKDVTKTHLSKKQKNKKTQEIRLVTELVQNKNSFFDFFSDLTVPSCVSLDRLSPTQIEEIRSDLESHYSTGIIIRDRIVPFAVKWYLGEMESDESDDDWDFGYSDSEQNDEFTSDFPLSD